MQTNIDAEALYRMLAALRQYETEVTETARAVNGQNSAVMSDAQWHMTQVQTQIEACTYEIKRLKDQKYALEQQKQAELAAERDQSNQGGQGGPRRSDELDLQIRQLEAEIQQKEGRLHRLYAKQKKMQAALQVLQARLTAFANAMQSFASSTESRAAGTESAISRAIAIIEEIENTNILGF